MLQTGVNSRRYAALNAPDDLLQEEVARENQQRIEAERQSVDEAMTELDQRREEAEDMEAQYSSVRERLAQLPEDMEPLKVRWCLGRTGF